MERIRLVLAIAHLLCFAGSISFYIQPSWIAFIAIGLGFIMRWMTPVIEKEGTIKSRFMNFFFAVWAAMLGQWLSTRGLKEVIESMIKDRLSLFPFILTVSLLLSFVIRDWILFLKLSPEEFDQYYSKELNT